MKHCHIVVLISGSGSNLQAIIDKLDNSIAKISAVISNNAQAYGLVRAQKANIPCEVISPKQFAKREQFNDALLETVEKYQPDLVVLAGFMLILNEKFVAKFQGKLLNIHPSLLPKYPGLHTHQTVLANNETFHGSTVHFVSNILDGGPIIAQSKLTIHAGETVESLEERVKQLEHELYPKVINWFAQGRIHLTPQGVEFDQKPITMHQLNNTDF